MTSFDIISMGIDCSENSELNDYVWLRKDEKGYYIEYAYLKGVPEYNRCLAEETKYREINKIYKLCTLTCSSTSGCKVGIPKKGCDYFLCQQNWSIESPGKCACWYLEKDSPRLVFSFEDLEKFANLLKNYDDYWSVRRSPIR